MKTRTRIASAVGAAAALVLGTAGTALASQNAVPGDTLYDVKIALEQAGLTEGGFPERIHEATIMSERGDESGALSHLANSIENEGLLPPCPTPGDDDGGVSPEPSPSPEPSVAPSPEPSPSPEPDADDCDTSGARDALLHAAESVLKNGSDQSLEVRTAVAEMLTWMATTDAKGKDFGQGVAERARAIHAGPDGTTEEDGTDDKGKPDHAGPPPGRGPGAGDDDDETDDDGNKGSGKPDHAGPPDGKGRP